ncbi:GAF domain-containing protein [Pseudonocardia sp. ICBG1034]|uniref:GAF domain-containing protein n=1 Tax=Pseudonocardia sp. ICBG1034 TaxID=2844381 RepID=UPI001CD0346D
MCTVRRVDDAGQLVRVARYGPDAATGEALDERPAETSFGLRVLDTGAAVLWDDTAPGATVPGSSIPARSAVGVPLSARGRTLAVLVLVRARGPRRTPLTTSSSSPSSPTGPRSRSTTRCCSRTRTSGPTPTGWRCCSGPPRSCRPPPTRPRSPGPSSPT